MFMEIEFTAFILSSLIYIYAMMHHYDALSYMKINSEDNGFSWKEVHNKLISQLVSEVR